MNYLRSQVQHIAKTPATEKPTWRCLTACFATIAMILVTVLALTPRAWGQENATINGTVLDSTGAVIPNARITLANPATGQSREVTSNGTGAFRFANVGVGTYTLSTAIAGFQKYTKTGIVVNVDQTLEENISLAVGSQGQSVIGVEVPILSQFALFQVHILRLATDAYSLMMGNLTILAATTGMVGGAGFVRGSRWDSSPM
jgi:Carboxypeptidase regulatory-like domain